MKKLKLLSFLLLTNLSFVNAQNNIWPDSLAEWYYQIGTPPFGIQGNTYYEMERDTLIQTKNCKIYSGLSKSKNSSIPNDPLFTYAENIAFISYEEDNILYNYNTLKNTFDTIVDFKAGPGDSWRSSVRNYCANISQNSDIHFNKTVTDTGHTIINGLDLKWLATEIVFPESGSEWYILVDTFYQYIGSKNYFLLVEDCPFLSDDDDQTFRCFHWNTGTPFEYHYEPTPQPCEFVSSVGIDEYAKSNLQIYPNPTSDLLNIISDHDEDIQFTDLNGRILLEAKLKPEIVNTFNIQDFESGIYYILCENKLYKVFKQ